ncbi:MAG: M20 family dipeptidase [Lentisphaerae bacterium]|nr:M20 family dipeptidase [Lentisphaerota bacterium]
MTMNEIIDAAFTRHRDALLADYFELLRFPSVSSDPARLGDCARCAAWLKRYLSRLGFSVEIVLAGDQPLLIAERAGATRPPTVLFYGHYDVQPADPLELWKTPPFEPTLIDDRVYARGAQDNKGQFFAFLAGVGALIEAGVPLPPLRILLDSQEESGSRALHAALPDLRRRLAAHVLLVGDTGMHTSGRLAITAGLRGLSHLTVRLSGPDHDLHSGTHGGVAPNPAMALARLIATLHDDDGRVAVPGFYDRLIPPTEEERRQANRLPFDPEAYQRETGTQPTGGERAYNPIERGCFRPTIEVNGIQAGHTGPGTKTIIPAGAVAKLSMRLVPGQSPEGVIRLVSEHLKRHTPPGLTLEIGEAQANGPGFRLPLDSPLVRLASGVLEQMAGEPPVFLWEGASVPIVSALQEQTGAAPLLVGFGLGEDRIHAPNESFSLTQFQLMMRFGGLFLAELAARDA